MQKLYYNNGKLNTAILPPFPDCKKSGIKFKIGNSIFTVILALDARILIAQMSSFDKNSNLSAIPVLDTAMFA